MPCERDAHAARALRPFAIALLLLAGVAHAEPAPRLVNLLTTVPATVAVSSTVANADLLPEHLVDGKLATAWNSKTGELTGARIGVRLPPDVQVKSIKLTAGFAHKKASGDLFTMNPRIKKVGIFRAGEPLIEHTLDVENRALQEIAIDQPGGDFEIRVLEIVPGSKPLWREICVSELEVWGTLAATAKAAKSTPSVRIGSLDAAPTLTREQCIRALFPEARGNRTGSNKDDDTITGVEVLPLRDDVVICRIDHASKGASSSSIEIGAVKRGREPRQLGRPIHESTAARTHSDGMKDEGSIVIELFTLTQSETGLLVHATQSSEGHSSSGKKVSTLYRVSSSGFDTLLDFESEWSGTEGHEHSTRRTLKPVTPGKSMPARLIVECVQKDHDWDSENPRRRDGETETRKERYAWTGINYAKQ